ncbi:hypothetical protein O4215_08245 [Rhodococcus maanshanensis]|uniref:hypothetical protein n=1 Tax=Rhodococcus maanshanensis TaxID=183556 RepID=UPI0022B58E7D|nr:hypothetical protein [Rhodococcus maanshanensis]MCZ4555565.1 hypothetical protein [Rhodococcus maanshanensis]
MEAVTESTAAVADHGRVMVRSEFAPLRTVAVARSQFRAPDEMSDSEASFLAPEALPILERMLGRDHGDVYPDRQRLWEAERENLCSVFERHGVEVLRPRMLTDTEKAAGGSKGYANFFVRDPWFTIGDIVIEGNLRLPHRRREVLPSRDLLTARALEGRCSYLALPQPAVPDGAPGDLGAGPFLEGGDVLGTTSASSSATPGWRPTPSGSAGWRSCSPRWATPWKPFASRRTSCTSTVPSA